MTFQQEVQIVRRFWPNPRTFSARQGGGSSGSFGDEGSNDSRGSADEPLPDEVGRQVLRAAGEATSLAGVFAGREPLFPDPAPGWNTLVIQGLPRGTRMISVKISPREASSPSAGLFQIAYAELFDEGTWCRVRYELRAAATLPAIVEYEYGDMRGGSL